MQAQRGNASGGSTGPSAQRWPALVATTGPNAGRSFTIGGVQVVLGRDADAGIVLPNGTVSRRHALVRREGDAITVQDLGSSNGTWVNGVRVLRPVTLEPGDLIRLGDIELQFGFIGRQDHGTARVPATYDFGDVAGPVVAGMGNLYAGGNQYVARGNIHHGDAFDIDVSNDYDPWDEVWQGKGLGRVLMVLGGLIALVGFGIWTALILSGFDATPTGPTPFDREVAGIPVAVIGFSMFGGGGVLAAIGSGMSKAARKRAEKRWRR